MNKDLNQLISVYRRVWQSVRWQPYPFDENMVYTSDDTVIENVLVRLNQLNPASNPHPSVMEKMATDAEVHYIVVGYDEEMILYWFTYFLKVGDSGYRLYRITNFTGPAVNLLEYGHRFGLPESSMAAFYMDVFSRLNEWARLLDLPYRYEVELQDEYMGFEQVDKPSRIFPEPDTSPTRNRSFWRRLWDHLFHT
ncbi:hypothetical protein [Spirosoma pollinicola]|uniref:Uncharacterized protein n=1 Tax=Spirosoma pollinicola TaxID=2057025 RepID=A0A2K8Z8E0_9BACT|nr:hypothetical protein [Spirosoma pollinicola]AUD06143.1 hypothetical protein CWM47_32435 [Spirosoma pollinicola]